MESMATFPSSISEWLTFEREHRGSVMLFLVVAGGLLCFLTMAAKQSNVENTAVGDAIRNGSMFHIVMAISISLAVPVLMNLMVDICLDNFGKDVRKRKKSKTTNDKDILTDLEKFIFMVGVVIFPITSCFTASNRAILLASCASSAAVTSIFAILFSQLFFTNQCFSLRITSITYLFVFIRC